MYDELPIKHYKKQILYSVEHNQVTLISAETGSGKTTQIPQFLIQAGYTLNDKKIGIILPRKIAAISIAKRVSQELACFNGEIAHKVRFNSTVNGNTRVVFMTDGTLVQQLYSSPLLEDYSVIVLDDVHERSLNYQILFGFLKKILEKRTNLKVIITSASMDGDVIKHFFEMNKQYKNQEKKEIKAKSINITGRCHDVLVHYLKEPTKNYFLKTFQTVVYIDRQKGLGDVLVFLPSVEELEGLKIMLQSYTLENKRRLKLLLLHSKLSFEQQNQIFEPSNDRKIILSTNIAESSITIPEIKYVIDSGFVKVKCYDWEKGVEKMIVVACGKSSAMQRAGRAGRVMSGQCFRIYHQEGFKRMRDKLPPEIMRVDLSNVVLKLKGLGIADILSFPMLQPPSEESIIRSIDTLYAYELIDESFELTEKGKFVCELSTDIRNGCMLVNSFDPKFGCSRQILMLVSMLQVNDVFSGQGLGVLKSKKKVGCKEGDFMTLINYYIRYHKAKINDRKRICKELKLKFNSMEQALKVYDELLNQFKKFNRFSSQKQQMEYKYGQSKKTIFELKSSSDEYEAILRCILTGYFTNIAQIQSDGSYLNIRSQQKLKIHSTSILSVVYPEWIVYHQIIKSSGYNIHSGSLIYPEWIFELAGHYYKDKRKDQAQESYQKDAEMQREDYMPKQQIKGLIEVGVARKKPEVFNKGVLGLKKMKKSKLSFQDEEI